MHRVIKLFRLTFLFGLIFLVCITLFSSQSFSQLIANGEVIAGETHQTMEGFGASIAWYENILANHPFRDSICYYIFNNLGLDILRLRNVYRDNTVNFASDFHAIVEANDLNSGIYLYQINAGNPESGSGQVFIKQKKMILVK